MYWDSTSNESMWNDEISINIGSYRTDTVDVTLALCRLNQHGVSLSVESVDGGPHSEVV
jgi:hypothetical protein